MNFQQLEYVMTIYHEGSLTKAASKLYISQPALSQQLRKLENEVGIQLFDRHTVPLQPTYAGKHYLEVIQKILFENQQAMNWLDDIHSLNRGKITIGISNIRSTQFLPALLPGFRTKYPNIEIEIKEAPALSLPDMISKGEIDFALMIAHSDMTNMTFLPVLTEHVLLAVPKDAPINELCKKSIQQNGFLDFHLLKDEPFIMLKHGHRLRKIAYDMFRKADIMPPIVLTTENLVLAHQMVIAGYGLTLIGEISASLTYTPSRPNYYPVTGDNCTWHLGIAYHPEKYVSKAMEAFFSHVMDNVAKLPHPHLANE